MVGANGLVSDLAIDKVMKKFLGLYHFGYYLKNMSAHLDYFYNTLPLDLKGKIENPYKVPENYPAFRYRADAGPNVKRESVYPDKLDERMQDMDLNSTPVKSEQNVGITAQTPKNIKLPHLSIQDAMRRNSQIFMARMSVYQQHQMIINPLNFSKLIINEVESNMSSELLS